LLSAHQALTLCHFQHIQHKDHFSEN
jgi:hypothetical protein